MGLILVVLGLILWLAGGWFILGIILIAVGIVLMFTGPYGYGWYRGRGAPPP